MTDNRQILIDSLPSDKLAVSNYRMETNPAPEPADGQVQVRTLALTVAAGTRAGLQGSASYAGAPKAGIVMNGTAVGRVTESLAGDVAVGDLVVCPAGWQDYSVHDRKQINVIDPAEASDVGDIAQYLSALGTNGLTAYFGLLEIGKPQAGDTVLVSAAAGSVGHIVGQIAKIKGARVVGVAGSDEKCAMLTSDLGFDTAVNHRDGGLRDNLRAACPDGIDVYFDNTGGPILGTALFNMNIGGRIACCRCGVSVRHVQSGSRPEGDSGAPGQQAADHARFSGVRLCGAIRRRTSRHPGLALVRAAEIDSRRLSWPGRSAARARRPAGRRQRRHADRARRRLTLPPDRRRPCQQSIMKTGSAA